MKVRQRYSGFGWYLTKKGRSSTATHASIQKIDTQAKESSSMRRSRTRCLRNPSQRRNIQPLMTPVLCLMAIVSQPRSSIGCFRSDTEIRSCRGRKKVSHVAQPHVCAHSSIFFHSYQLTKARTTTECRKERYKLHILGQFELSSNSLILYPCEIPFQSCARLLCFEQQVQLSTKSGASDLHHSVHQRHTDVPCQTDEPT